MNHPPSIALALSGGGSRAIAFHLGCMRELHRQGILPGISVISAVSGGSVIAGLYAYSSDSFESFDQQIVALLRCGLQRDILKRLLRPGLFGKVVATNLISRPLALGAQLLGHQPPFRRWASRSNALEEALSKYFGRKKMGEVERTNLDVILNACELRTATAFRFGNLRSGSWRFGEVAGNDISVAHAVACSAAYPMFLPAFDRKYDFVRRDGTKNHDRVIITDGGVYDNLGTTCVEPERDPQYSLHTYTPDYILCCSAGYGQLSGQKIPFTFFSRTAAAFETVFRKATDATMNRLHYLRSSGKLRGFILPYLGQQDKALPSLPSEFVSRDAVLGYPTNFEAMPDEDIKRLTTRGEQLTKILLEHHTPELCRK